MSLKDRLVSAKNRVVAALPDKQTLLNAFLIGATIGTVISLRAINNRLETQAYWLGELEDEQDFQASHPYHTEDLGDNKFRARRIELDLDKPVLEEN